MSGVHRLARIRLNARAPEALADFFIAALGFSHLGQDGDVTTLALGNSRLDIADVGAASRAYPGGVRGWSPLFQHFAMVTDDIDAAVTRLERASGWRPITQGGLQRLPASSGGATAFKFRDPEGHPLELIQFAQGNTNLPPRIDHSAISVADTARSVAFYEGLGLTAGWRSLNRGQEQARLDGLPGAEVEVTALRPAVAHPHVELLRYRGAYPRSGRPAGLNDVAATRLVLTVAGHEDLAAFAADLVRDGDKLLLRDPDGHLLQIEIAPS